MVDFIDKHRHEYGAQPICKVLPIALSTYYQCKAMERNPEKRSARTKRDEELSAIIERVWGDNFQVYGVRKMWHALKREGIVVARCTIARLMASMGLHGAIRGKRYAVTTQSDDTQERPRDLVRRDFSADAPNQLWVADITYVPTQKGYVYTAFIVDVFSTSIVGWCVSSSLGSGLALSALEQALYARDAPDGLVHHSDRGVQYLSIRYTDRLLKAGIANSVGSVGDSYDNALAESINGLYKTEVIRKRGPWRGPDDVEYATLEWVDWFNNRRLYEKLGNVPPMEYEKDYYLRKEGLAMVA